MELHSMVHGINNCMRESTLELYPNVVKLIFESFSTTQIADKIGVSWPTILKLVRFKDEVEVLDKLQHNNNHSRARGLRKTLGHAAGRTYEEIYGVEKAKEMKAKRSKWLRENNIRKHCVKVSKPQAMLYAIVKQDYSSAELEYEILMETGKRIYLDIAIPKQKINIEYDGMYWHKKNDPTIRVKDVERDAYLKSKGWKVFRFQHHNNPTEEQLITEYKQLQL
jgi:very-short-patch-repair endonuclease